MYPIADLHSDLLSFLAEDAAHTINEPKSRASYPQMKQGGVAIQTLAIFTQSKPGSLLAGTKQLEAFHTLLDRHQDKYALFTGEPSREKIALLLAFENACGFCEEKEPIQNALDRLETVSRSAPLLYISLTWDGENRFGGGNGTKIGLKEDGKRILEWLDQKKIAIDLSHTSDFLADGILNFLDKQSLSIPVIASHSNARSVENRERNLPDFLIQEIVSRKGIIGLNLFAPFLGKSVEALIPHVAHFFKLGAENQLCFGADFFPDLSFDYLLKKYQAKTGFFPEMDNASCYPYALTLLEKELALTKSQLQGIGQENFLRYVRGS